MAFTIDHLKTYYLGNWKFRNMLGGSKYAVLFPNELRQDGGGFNQIVKFPVMTEATLQESWNQKTGFNETDATEQTVEIKLTKNFTSYTKIAKVNIPANWETWAGNKITIIERQEAKQLDDFVLDQIGNNVGENKIEGEIITKDNIIKELKKLEKYCETKKFRLEDTIIFVSSDVMVALLESKLSSVANNIENTSATITQILGRYSVVEAPIDKYKFQMIALLPTAFAWANAVETPLQAGEYTQGPFLGQIFTAVNKFYNGEILLPEYVVGMTAKAAPESKEEKSNLNQQQIDAPLNNFKSMIFDEFKTQFAGLKDFKTLEKTMKEQLANAKDVATVKKVEAEIKDKAEKKEKTEA